MSSMVKNVFTYMDLFFGYLTSALVRVLLYGLTAVCSLAAVLFVFVAPFDENFDLNELDNLELLVLLIFILVSIRFFKRSKLEGIALWPCIKSYCFISTFLSHLCLAFVCLAFAALFEEKLELDINEGALYLDLAYFLFSTIYIVALYAFAPLPKINRLFQNKNEERTSDPIVLPQDKWHEDLEGTIFYTDSNGSTNTDNIMTDNKRNSK